MKLMRKLTEDVTLVSQSTLRWYGHIMRKEVMDEVRRVLDVDLSGVVRRGCPRVGWRLTSGEGCVCWQDFNKNMSYIS